MVSQLSYPHYENSYPWKDSLYIAMGPVCHLYGTITQLLDQQNYV